MVTCRSAFLGDHNKYTAAAVDITRTAANAIATLLGTRDTWAEIQPRARLRRLTMASGTMKRIPRGRLQAHHVRSHPTGPLQSSRGIMRFGNPGTTYAGQLCLCQRKSRAKARLLTQ